MGVMELGKLGKYQRPTMQRATWLTTWITHGNDSGILHDILASFGPGNRFCAFDFGPMRI